MKGWNPENILIALRSIRGQVLRTTLTALIIAVGIMALVGILTSIDALQYKITNDFSRMGANTLNISNRVQSLSGSRDGKRTEPNPPLTYNQAEDFKERFDFPAVVSISSQVTFSATVKYGSEKTNPNVQVLAGSIDYLTTTGYEIESGRNFSENELEEGRGVVIIGKDVEDNLFKGVENPIGKAINIGGDKFTVIGLLKSKGNSMGFSGDNQCIIPISYARLNYNTSLTSYVLNVQTSNAQDLETAETIATGVLRSIRKDKPTEDNSFGISKSDNLANMLIEQISLITIIATVIGVITLLGAAIGLMNIMLVSVTERTREIGVRKAIGASAGTIRNQFLVEAIVIGQLGGILGIILGIAVGNVIAAWIGIGFIIPWKWIIGGMILCFLVGVASGFYPAKKAADLDPIDSLRYE